MKQQEKEVTKIVADLKIGDTVFLIDTTNNRVISREITSLSKRNLINTADILDRTINNSWMANSQSDKFGSNIYLSEDDAKRALLSLLDSAIKAKAANIVIAEEKLKEEMQLLEKTKLELSIK